MNVILKILFQVVLITLFKGFKAQCQTPRLDSLKLAFKTAKHDSERCAALAYLSENENDPEIWPKYNEKLKTISELNLKSAKPASHEYFLFAKFYATAINNLGYLSEQHGEFVKALEYYEQSLKIQKEINDKSGIAACLNNIGFIYDDQGNILKALEYYNNSLKMYEDLADKSGIANLLNNIGTVIEAQGDLAVALQYYQRNLKIMKNISNKFGLAASFNNIGNIFSALGEKDSAMINYVKCLKLREEINDQAGLAICLSNIAHVHFSNGNLEKASQNHFMSLKIRKTIDDKAGIANSLNNIASVYFKQKKVNEALDYCLKSMQLSLKLGFAENIVNAAKQLNLIYKTTGNYKLALENYELYIQMSDSLNNQNTRKASIKSQLKYEYEKQAAADSVAHAKESEIKNVQLQKQTTEIKAKKNQQYVLFGGLGLVIIFSGFMYNRFKITQKQKGIIEEQKELVEEQKKIVEEKQKEVLDSIHYAKRIQTAHLPSEKYIARILEKNLNR